MPIRSSFGSLAALGPGTFHRGDMEHIATVTVGAGGAASMEFTSIPQTFKHLQVREVVRSSQALAVSTTEIQFNADTGSNYARHVLYGDGAAAAAAGQASQTKGWVGTYPGSSIAASIFGAGIIDVLDYANTSKNTTARALSGVDVNGATGYLQVCSTAWLSTAAVTSIKLIAGTGYAQHSTAALYGIR
jgi:hypothetical protein